MKNWLFIRITAQFIHMCDGSALCYLGGCACCAIGGSETVRDIYIV